MFERIMMNQFSGGQGKMNPASILISLYGMTPGPNKLLWGDAELGFFGEVDSSEFTTIMDLTSKLSFWDGILKVSRPKWLKFSYKRKVLFIAKEPVTYSNDWSIFKSRNMDGTDDVDNFVNVGGVTFVSRLIEGVEENPSSIVNGDNPEGSINSEWGQLIERVSLSSTLYPKEEKWATYSDKDLGVAGYGPTTMSLNQHSTLGYFVGRGEDYVGEVTRLPIGRNSSFGWRPVLEAVDKRDKLFKPNNLKKGSIRLIDGIKPTFKSVGFLTPPKGTSSPSYMPIIPESIVTTVLGDALSQPSSLSFSNGSLTYPAKLTVESGGFIQSVDPFLQDTAYIQAPSFGEAKYSDHLINPNTLHVNAQIGVIPEKLIFNSNGFLRPEVLSNKAGGYLTTIASLSSHTEDLLTKPYKLYVGAAVLSEPRHITTQPSFPIPVVTDLIKRSRVLLAPSVLVITPMEPIPSPTELNVNVIGLHIPTVTFINSQP